MSKRSFIVTLDVPKGVTLDEIEDYITSAVGTWCGAGDPDEPLFDLDRDSVKVKRIVRKRPQAW